VKVEKIEIKTIKTLVSNKPCEGALIAFVASLLSSFYLSIFAFLVTFKKMKYLTQFYFSFKKTFFITLLSANDKWVEL